MLSTEYSNHSLDEYMFVLNHEASIGNLISAGAYSENNLIGFVFAFKRNLLIKVEQLRIQSTAMNVRKGCIFWNDKNHISRKKI